MNHDQMINALLLVRIEDFTQQNNCQPQRLLAHPLTLDILNIVPRELQVETSLEIEPFGLVELPTRRE